MSTPRTLAKAIEFFANPGNARHYLISRRWPSGIACPQCGGKAVYHDSSRDGWECKSRHPKRKFTLKTGTVFEDSALALEKWLVALWMVANQKTVGSHEVARTIGVTQKTAWLMLQRIRLALEL